MKSIESLKFYKGKEQLTSKKLLARHNKASFEEKSQKSLKPQNSYSNFTGFWIFGRGSENRLSLFWANWERAKISWSWSCSSSMVCTNLVWYLSLHTKVLRFSWLQNSIIIVCCFLKTLRNGIVIKLSFGNLRNFFFL